MTLAPGLPEAFKVGEGESRERVMRKRHLVCSATIIFLVVLISLYKYNYIKHQKLGGGRMGQPLTLAVLSCTHGLIYQFINYHWGNPNTVDSRPEHIGNQSQKDHFIHYFWDFLFFVGVCNLHLMNFKQFTVHLSYSQ